jgi:hypothetical protein
MSRPGHLVFGRYATLAASCTSHRPMPRNAKNDGQGKVLHRPARWVRRRPAAMAEPAVCLRATDAGSTRAV